MIRQTYHIDHPDGTVEVKLCKGCEEQGDEPTVEVTDCWGNRCDIPVSVATEVLTCMHSVLNEHLERVKTCKSTPNT